MKRFWSGFKIQQTQRSSKARLIRLNSWERTQRTSRGGKRPGSKAGARTALQRVARRRDLSRDCEVQSFGRWPECSGLKAKETKASYRWNRHQSFQIGPWRKKSPSSIPTFSQIAINLSKGGNMSVRGSPTGVGSPHFEKRKAQSYLFERASVAVVFFATGAREKGPI